MKVATDLRQRDALSSVLLNLVLEKIVRKINFCEGIDLSRSTINILAIFLYWEGMDR